MKTRSSSGHRLARFSLIICLGLAAGCSTPTYLVEEGKASRTNARREQEYATVFYGGGGVTGLSMILMSVDGVRPHDRRNAGFESKFNFASRVKVLPGEHVLSFGNITYSSAIGLITESGPRYYPKGKSVHIRVEAGHAYKITAKVGGDKDDPITVAVEDKGTAGR